MSDPVISLLACLVALSPFLIGAAVSAVADHLARRRHARDELAWLESTALDWFGMLRRQRESRQSFRARIRARLASPYRGTLGGIRAAAEDVPGVLRVLAVEERGTVLVVRVEVDPRQPLDSFRVRAAVAHACFDVAPAPFTITVESV